MKRKKMDRRNGVKERKKMESKEEGNKKELRSGM